jgi:hypothetical protein
VTRRREFVVSLPVEDDLSDDAAARDVAQSLIFANGMYGGEVWAKPGGADDDAWIKPETWNRGWAR